MYAVSVERQRRIAKQYDRVRIEYFVILRSLRVFAAAAFGARAAALRGIRRHFVDNPRPPTQYVGLDGDDTIWPVRPA